MTRWDVFRLVPSSDVHNSVQTSPNLKIVRLGTLATQKTLTLGFQKPNDSPGGSPVVRRRCWFVPCCFLGAGNFPEAIGTLVGSQESHGSGDRFPVFFLLVMAEGIECHPGCQCITGVVCQPSPTTVGMLLVDQFLTEESCLGVGKLIGQQQAGYPPFG